jgi:ABC-type uncharacterized transport system permease subunit
MQPATRQVFAMTQRRMDMFEFVVIGLLALWALGLLTSFYMGGLIHILLFLSIALVMFRSRLGRRE